jgi:hypothetical protein
MNIYISKTAVEVSFKNQKIVRQESESSMDFAERIEEELQSENVSVFFSDESIEILMPVEMKKILPNGVRYFWTVTNNLIRVEIMDGEKPAFGVKMEIFRARRGAEIVLATENSGSINPEKDEIPALAILCQYNLIRNWERVKAIFEKYTGKVKNHEMISFE